MNRITTPIALCVSLGLAMGCTRETKSDTDVAVVSASSDTAAVDSAATASMAPATGMLDPNSASQPDLLALGVSDSAAAAVIAGRPYANMVAVDRVLAKHLTEPRRDSVYGRLWLPVKLNSATDEEIQLIPGVGPRMLREFKEYRPFTSIEHFRREIGKYVDRDELARLEKYVSLQ